MEFYHDLITEKSFKILQDLKRKYSFVLIGGWAVFLYTKALKSKDIDIVIDYDALDDFKRDFDISKNERLKKYEAKFEGIDIDIYLPHFSEIGFPLEELEKYSQSIEGFLVPVPEILLILKIQTFEKRKGTAKGKKDLIDIFSFLSKKIIDWRKYKELIENYGLAKTNEDLKNLVSLQTPIPELHLSNHKIAKLKKEILRKL